MTCSDSGINANSLWAGEIFCQIVTVMQHYKHPAMQHVDCCCMRYVQTAITLHGSILQTWQHKKRPCLYLNAEEKVNPQSFVCHWWAQQHWYVPVAGCIPAVHWSQKCRKLAPAPYQYNNQSIELVIWGREPDVTHRTSWLEIHECVWQPKAADHRLPCHCIAGSRLSRQYGLALQLRSLTCSMQLVSDMHICICRFHWCFNWIVVLWIVFDIDQGLLELRTQCVAATVTTYIHGWWSGGTVLSQSWLAN